MTPAQTDFLRYQVIPLLRAADPTTPPKWGKMSFQHMVEHMVLAVKNANGKLKTDNMFTPPEKLEAFRDFLRSDKVFRENTKSPAFPDDPLPLHFPSADQAILKLEKEIKDFFDVYAGTPGLKIRNSIFGDLDYDLAVQLLYKHAQHHLKQFGLI